MDVQTPQEDGFAQSFRSAAASSRLWKRAPIVPRDVRDGFVRIAGDDLPAGGRTRTLRTPDGANIRAAWWRPEGRTRGTVFLLQGRAEFIEKYAEVAADLLKRGFAVATFDFRGQGGSQRLLGNAMKGHVADFDDYRADAETVMRQLVLTDCPPPYFALVHSMAAPVAVNLVNRQPQWFDRVVLEAPMIGLPLARAEFFARGLASGLGRVGFSGAYIPGGNDRVLALKPFEGNRVTSDAKRYQRSISLINEAPDLALGSPTVGWIYAAFRAMTSTAVAGVPEAFRVPTLVLTAGADRIVDPIASERFANRIRRGGHLFVRGSRHEIMMERDEIREMFWAAFDAFVPGKTTLA